MRIGIDARFYSEQGHGRYIRNLLDQLQNINSDNQYVVFLIKKDFDTFQVASPKFQKILADVRWYTLAEQTKLLKIFLDAKLDILHVPHFNIPIFYPKSFIITVHDLTITHYATIRATTLPYPVWKIKRMAYKLVLAIALRRAKKIIAVSNFTKSEILKHYPNIKSEKIVVTKEAVEESFIHATKIPDRITDDTMEKFGIKKPYLLYIGNAHPHKNIDRLIRVFNRIYRDRNGDIQLVLVGKDDYFQKRIRSETAEQGLDQGLIWPGFISDENLIPLIKGAKMFVFPSLMEGFGIPPLEAMACGVPTVISNAGSLPEICGDASVYFDPKNEEDMKKKIEHVLSDENLRNDLIQKGLLQIKKYSWRELAEETLQIYITILEK